MKGKELHCALEAKGVKTYGTLAEMITRYMKKYKTLTSPAPSSVTTPAEKEKWNEFFAFRLLYILYDCQGTAALQKLLVGRGGESRRAIDDGTASISPFSEGAPDKSGVKGHPPGLLYTRFHSDEDFEVVPFDDQLTPAFHESGIHPNRIPCIPFPSKDLISRYKEFSRNYQEVYDKWDRSGRSSGLSFSNFTNSAILQHAHALFEYSSCDLFQKCLAPKTIPGAHTDYAPQTHPPTKKRKLTTRPLFATISSHNSVFEKAVES